MTYRSDDSSHPADSEHALIGGHTAETALVAQQTGLPVPIDMTGMNGFASPDLLRRGMDANTLFHALRRRWILALCMGLVAAGITSIAMWFLFPESSSAVIMFKVGSDEDMQLLVPRRIQSPQAFDMVKKTQLASIKSQWLMQAALRDPSTRSVPALADERDPVQWLLDNVVVDFPQQGQLLTISISGDDRPEDQKQLVNAVAKAYESEFLYKDKQQKLLLTGALRTSLDNLNKQILRDTQQFLDLATELGSAKTTDSRAEIELLTRQVQDLMKQQSDLQAKMIQQRADYAMALEQLKDPQITKDQVNGVLNADPMLASLKQQLSGYQLQAITAQSSAQGRKSSAALDKRFNKRTCKFNNIVHLSSGRSSKKPKARRIIVSRCSPNSTASN